MTESAAQYVRRAARDRLESYRSMASGRFLYEPTDVERAKKILPRVAELQAQGLELIDAVKTAEREHPPVPFTKEGKR